MAEIFYHLFICPSDLCDVSTKERQDTYSRLIDQVTKVGPNWLSTSIMMDLEHSSMSAFQNQGRPALNDEIDSFVETPIRQLD